MALSFRDLETSGLLWLFNETALHPRGHHLSLIFEDGELTGWDLFGDGTEVCRHDDTVDSDAAFATVNRFLKEMGDVPGNTL